MRSWRGEEDGRDDASESNRAPIAPGRVAATSRIPPSAVSIARAIARTAATAAPVRVHRSAAALAPSGIDPFGVHLGGHDPRSLVDAAAQQSGGALPAELRARLEAHAGADLSSVRVHTDDTSARAAKAIGAHAYTIGNDVHFAAGAYDPGSARGQHLIAHEVAHTLQPQSGAPAPKLEVSTPDDAHEIEAERFADAFLVAPSSPAAPRLVAPVHGVAPRLVAGVRAGVISREPDAGAGPGDQSGAGPVCADATITLPPKVLFPRKQWDFKWGGTAETVHLPLVSTTILGKQVSFGLAASGVARLDWQGGYGAGLLQNVSGSVGGCADPNGVYPRGSLTGEIVVPIGATNDMELTGGIGVGLASTLSELDVRTSLEGTLTAKARASASSDIRASARIRIENGQGFMTVSGKIAPQLSGTADLLAGVQLLVELKDPWDNGKKPWIPDVPRPPLPDGFPELPDWVLPKKKDGPRKWTKAWGKRWKLFGRAWKGGWTVEQSYTFQFLGNRVTKDGIDGEAMSALTPQPTTFPVAEFLQQLNEAPAEGEADGDDGKQDGKAPEKGPDDVEIQHTAQGAKAALEGAEHAVSDEQKRHERRMQIRDFGGVVTSNEIHIDEPVAPGVDPDDVTPRHHRRTTSLRWYDAKGRVLSDTERDHEKDRERGDRVKAARAQVIALESQYIGAIELAGDADAQVLTTAQGILAPIAAQANAIREAVLGDAARDITVDKAEQPDQPDPRIAEKREQARAALDAATAALGDEKGWTEIALANAGEHVQFRDELEKRGHTLSRWTRSVPQLRHDLARASELSQTGEDGNEALQILLDVVEDAQEIVANVRDLHDSRPQRSDDDVEKEDDAPSDEQLQAARTDARQGLDGARRHLDDVQRELGTELSRTRDDLRQHPPSDDDRPRFDAYVAELEAILVKVREHKGRLPGMENEFRTAETGARSTEPAKRSNALSSFRSLTDRSEEMIEDTKEKPERPKRSRARNKYNARREGAGFSGGFVDFPDWDGYPGGATRHPANRYSGNTGGVPRPNGAYKVPGPATRGNLHTAQWRRDLSRERDEVVRRLEDEHRKQHPGQPVPDLTAQANAEVVKRYRNQGFSLSWDELWLDGFEEHHIHESSWGGPHASKNMVYLREEEHYDFTSWWETRKADVFRELKKDDP